MTTPHTIKRGNRGIRPASPRRPRKTTKQEDTTRVSNLLSLFSSAGSQTPLRRLDLDSLHIIFEELRPNKALRPLSLTCKWIREACKPVLFRRCRIRSYDLDRSKEPDFICRSLWPYICSLTFSGAFCRPDLPRYTDEDFGDLVEERRLEPLRRLVAAKRLGQYVRDALQLMPSLQSVGIFIPTSTLIWEPMHIPGVSWYVLEAIFTTPHVRHFRLVGPICHPADQFLPDVGLPPLVPMKSFLYELLDERHQPRTLETEKDVLLLVLDRIHDGLEQLALPSEAAPLDLMYDWNWSMLRELSLRGERPMGSRPFVEMLSKMPRLRVLSLVLAEPAGSQPPPIWPRTSDSSCSLRDLEQLSVTHPQPDDEFYRHLPMSLRRLSLRCWPRYYKHHSILKEFMTEAGIEWTSPILHSSDMLHILQQSKTPSLTHLELEYRADLEDGLLFSHICSSYPLLTVLRIHRYRREGEIEVPVADIAQALSGLINLRLLMIHLDFADLPDVTVLDEDSNFDEYTWPERLSQLRESYATNLCAANIFARALPSLEYVCILVPLRHRLQQWLPFRLVGRNEAGDVPCAEPLGYSGIGEKLHGYSIEKDD